MTARNLQWLKLISRISAWALLTIVIVFIISGWGITQTGIIYRISFGLIDRRTADVIHRAMDIPLGIFFISHLFANIRLMLKPKKEVLVRLTDIILVITGLGLLAIFIIMGRT